MVRDVAVYVQSCSAFRRFPEDLELVGLLGKNAILTSGFAVQRRQVCASIRDAGVDGGQLRFRPMLMMYYLFARTGDGRKLIKDEHDEPLSELFEREDRTDSIAQHGSAHADAQQSHDRQPDHNPPGEHQPGDSAPETHETGA